MFRVSLAMAYQCAVQVKAKAKVHPTSIQHMTRLRRVSIGLAVIETTMSPTSQHTQS